MNVGQSVGFSWGHNPGNILCLSGIDAKTERVTTPSPISLEGVVSVGRMNDIFGNDTVHYVMQDGQVYATTPQTNTFDLVLFEGLVKNVKGVFCGTIHTLFWMVDDTIYGYGENKDGCIDPSSGTKNIDTPVLVPLPSRVRGIWISRDHSAALLTDGRLFLWGQNNYGQLGIGTSDSSNYLGKATNILIPGGNRAIMAALGVEYTIVLMNNGSICSCGYNGLGQLGLDDFEERFILTCLTSDSIRGNVKTVHCAESFSSCVTNDGVIFYWGGQYSDHAFRTICVPMEVSFPFPYTCDQLSLGYDISLGNYPVRSCALGVFKINGESPSIFMITWGTSWEYPRPQSYNEALRTILDKRMLQLMKEGGQVKLIARSCSSTILFLFDGPFCEFSADELFERLEYMPIVNETLNRRIH